MRLDKVKRDLPLGAKVGFGAARVFGRVKVPDMAYVLTYRGELFGAPFNDWLNALLRGESAWSVGERELMAALTASRLRCEF